MDRKGIPALLLLTALLAGCGAADPAPAPASPPLPEIIEVSPAPTAAPASTPTPEPTPTPGPASLRELVPEERTVWVDGTALKALVLDGTAYLRADELGALWPWFRWQGGADGWLFTGQAPSLPEGGGPLSLPCVPCEQAEEGSAIRFAGQTEEFWLPLEPLCGALSLKYLWDGAEGQSYVTCVPYVDMDALAGRRIPVLMYHAVSDELWGLKELFVSPASMRSQLEYLTENGFDPIFFSDLSHIDDYDKPVLLTFDDGYRDNYTELFPLLREFGVKATCFVISGGMYDERFVTHEQAREMADSGLVDVQSHTADHYELQSLSREAQRDQMARSQLELARATGRIPYVVAYPNGGCNDATGEVGALYYDFGLLKSGGVWRPGVDRFAVTRSRVNRSTDLDAFAALVG